MNSTVCASRFWSRNRFLSPLVSDLPLDEFSKRLTRGTNSKEQRLHPWPSVGNGVSVHSIHPKLDAVGLGGSLAGLETYRMQGIGGRPCPESCSGCCAEKSLYWFHLCLCRISRSLQRQASLGLFPLRRSKSRWTRTSGCQVRFAHSLAKGLLQKLTHLPGSWIVVISEVHQTVVRNKPLGTPSQRRQPLLPDVPANGLFAYPEVGRRLRYSKLLWHIHRCILTLPKTLM